MPTIPTMDTSHTQEDAVAEEDVAGEAGEEADNRATDSTQQWWAS